MPRTTSPQKVVVTSLGSAGFPVLRALEGRCPLAGPELAAVLYQAPGVLFPSLDQADAESMLGSLRKVGLEVQLEDADAPFERGLGELDLSLQINDPSKMTEVLREVVLLLGLDGRSARDLLCRQPCLLVGQVSTATALAIGRRFDPAVAEIIAIAPQSARYDLYVTAGAADLQRRIVDNLKALGHIPQDSGPAKGHLIVEGLDHKTVQHLWEVVGQRGESVRVIAQELSRFDLVLDSPPEHEDGWQAIAELVGVPSERLKRLRERVPMVLKGALERKEAAEALGALAQLKVHAHLELVALQGFSLEISRCPKPAEAAKTIQQLTDQAPTKNEAALRKGSFTLSGPFTATRARWLQSELTALGCSCHLVKR